MKVNKKYYFRCSQDILKITYCKVCKNIKGFEEYNFLDQNELDVYFGFMGRNNINSCCITTHIVEYVNGYSELNMDLDIKHLFKPKVDKFVDEIMSQLKNEFGNYYNDMSKKYAGYDTTSSLEKQEKLKEAERLYSKGFITRTEYEQIKSSLTKKK